MHKYFNGTLILPKELFYKILDDIVISQSERILLWDLYYTELYGYETLDRIKALEQTILTIDASLILDKSFTEVPYTVDFTDFVKSNKFYLQKESDVLSAVRYLFNSNDGGKIYTNFPYSLEKLDTRLLTISGYCSANRQLFLKAMFSLLTRQRKNRQKAQPKNQL